MPESVARRAHAVLKQLLAIEDTLRDAEAARLCDGDAALRERVQQLLGALSKTDGFLESPIGRTIRDAASQSEQVGFPSIRGYTIERLIGVGGMAAVFEATQDLPRRRVALKVLRRSMAGSAALRRFEFETEVLARLRHPGIAPIFEAGTFDDGAGAIPFFAMEFIDGARTLTDYCESEGLDLQARLELTARVRDAVQHGHQNGVIHRDLKPGNVLVDATGAPRVIDFGIARSTTVDGAQAPTTLGQIVGTLNAMSPEQCMPHANVDARTDVYSLGVLLYELLCRRPPHELGALPIPEALRVIHDVAPTRPSAIDPHLRGDLEAIVLKAIEKDPERRYRTVAALGADIRRHLDHQTVEARPPTIFYQLRMLARRNRVVVTAALIVVVALVAASAISIVAAIRANEELQERMRAEGRAREERDTARRQTYIANIAAALSTMQFGDFTRLRGHLDAAPLEYRGWEWHWLSAFSDRSLIAIDAHRVGIMSMSASADGQRLVTAALDGGVRSWSLPDLAPGAADQLTCGAPKSSAMFPDGTRVAIACDDGNLVVMRVDDGTIEWTMRDGREKFSSVSVRGAGTFALANGAGELLVWDLARDAPSHRVNDQPGGINGVRYSPDGASLVTWSREGLVRLRDADSLETKREWSIGSDVGAIDVRPDLDRIAIGTAAGRVMLKRISSGEDVVTLAMRDQLSLVRSVAFSHDGQLIAMGQGSGAIAIAETETTNLRSMAFGHRDAVSSLIFAPDDRRLVSASWDGSLRVWDTERPSADSARAFTGHEGAVLGVAYAKPGVARRMATASADHTVRVWDTDTDREVAVLRGHDAEVYDVEFSPDATIIASAGFDKTVRLWNAQTGEPLRALVGHADHVWSVSFSPDGLTLASCGDDHTVRLWNVATGELLRTFEGHTGRVTNVAFSHDGSRIASSSRDRSVRIWSANDANDVRVLLGHEWDVFAVAWSLDDAELYSGSRDQTVRVWSTKTGESLAVLDDARQFVTSLALSPDGSRLVAGTWYSGLCLFDPKRREMIASFKVVSDVVRSVAFSPDGRQLAIGAGDGVVRILDASTPAERVGK